MRDYRGSNKWRNMAALLILAVVCIGGAELLACRVADPALFERLTGPCVRWARSVWEGARSQLMAFASFLPGEEPAATAGPLNEEQYATDPAVWLELAEPDPEITALVVRRDREILTGGSREIVYFNQGDENWSDQPYGNDTIGGYGCGPVALAMAVSSLTEADMDPAEMAEWAYDNGCWAKGSGSYYTIVDRTAAAFSLSVESCPDADADRLRQELSAGKVGVALMRSGHFTQKGHFILLRGVTLSGGVLVADPNSRERSLAVWNAEIILDELSATTVNGAPLWFLSPAEQTSAQ